jgi:hypothetical protein
LQTHHVAPEPGASTHAHNTKRTLSDPSSTSHEKDAKVIERFVLLESGPFEKGRAILDMADMDRLFREMLTMDRKEFFWCCVHGLMHLVPVQHDAMSAMSRIARPFSKGPLSNKTNRSITFASCTLQLIERFVLLESGPFEKGRAILDMADMDRLFREMLTMDRIIRL